MAHVLQLYCIPFLFVKIHSKIHIIRTSVEWVGYISFLGMNMTKVERN
jgi:hypothetical protein